MPREYRTVSAVVAVFASLGVSTGAAASLALNAEWALVFPGYNNVGVPGDGGTRFSLTDDFSAKRADAFRVRFEYGFADKHWIGVLVAPLELRSYGVAPREIQFAGETFSAGDAVRASFRFDSYRVLYRYQLFENETMRFRLGGALKVRDAEIELVSDAVGARKSNTGVVPLASFDFRWKASERAELLIDGEALAAPQGRAEDVLFAAQYHVNPSLSVRLGYRILEGGADNDEVYTFSLFHQAVVGASWQF